MSPNQGTWVITSFAVANGISVPLTGWLMRRYGVVRTYTVSVALFTLASFLCGIAWSFEALIAFRVLQGAMSGPMIPGSQTLLMAVFPASKRGFPCRWHGQGRALVTRVPRGEATAERA